MQCSITLWQFAKGAQTTFGAVAKSNRSLFFKHFAPGIRELHAKPIILALGELNLEYNKMAASLKFCLPSAVFILLKVYPTIGTTFRPI
jgi:hypothetical protein